MSLAEPKSPTGDAEPKLVNGEVNGVSNGHSEGSKHKSNSHKSSSKDKHRDKDRDRKEHRSSKSHHSSSSSSHRDRDKDHKSSHSSHKSSSKDKDRDRERDKDRSKDKLKDHKSSSKDKDREKERGKEHKNSSKDKDRHSSSSKDKHRDKDRHKSSSKDKHRDRDRHREHKSSSKDKRRDSEKHKKEEKVENGQQQQPPIVSEEPKITNECQVSIERYRPEPVEDPLDNSQASQASSCDYTMSQFKANEPEFDIKEEASDETDGETPSTKRKQIIESDNEEEEEKPLSVRKKLKEENSDEEDAPLISRKKIKNESDDEAKPLSARIKTTIESDEEAPLLQRKKKMDKKKKKRMESDEDDFEDERPKKKKVKKEKAKDSRAKVKTEEPITPVKGGRKKKDEEEQEVWKWWEEEKRADGVKWNFLEHKGPVFAPDYEPLPKNVHFEYDGKVVKLSQDAEEVAGFYAKMLESDYCQKKQFNENFFKDWRKVMSSSEKNLIKEFKKCNFKKMHAYFAAESEKNRNRSKEEKKALKEKNDEILKEYGMCTIDGHKEKIGNFKIEPPGLFRGRGEHPKMGMLKRRVLPSDITINCSKGSKWPKPPEGTRWKEVRHDNSVTWLASWTENVQNQVKYIMLNPSSKLKGEKDWQKYETARKLLKHIDQIRATYRDEWKSKEMRIRQRAVALYFIDKLALRAGNEKDEDQADTVGCCSLRVEHIELFREKDGKEYVVVFDFLGKDSIRYYNEVEVEKRVFKNLELFKENKKDGDDLFDRLNTSVLNEHLRELMEGLTAKVFRTFNASYTLQKQLDELTDPDMSVPEKLLAYNRANRAVAILCNHQRAVPKTHQKSMETLKEKIRLKREAVDECEREYKDLKRGNPALREKKKKQLERLKEQLKKLELQETDRDENKTIALGTSKLNYLDPRISVAWCKKFGVPIEKIFNKTQRDKFRWAIDMAGPEYVF